MSASNDIAWIPFLTDRVTQETLCRPLQWIQPRHVYLSAQHDLYQPGLPDRVVAAVFGLMAVCSHHTFLVPTVYPGRMMALSRTLDLPTCLETLMRLVRETTDLIRIASKHKHDDDWPPPWPLPNVVCGTVASDQAQVDERAPLVQATLTARRWLALDPLCGAVNLGRYLRRPTHLGWVVVAGERGGASASKLVNPTHVRPLHPSWVRSVRDQCMATTVPFRFTGWGDFVPASEVETAPSLVRYLVREDGRLLASNTDYAIDARSVQDGYNCVMYRVGPKAAGRRLDGRVYDAGIRPG